MVGHLFGLLGFAGLSVLFGACLYESVVMAPNYTANSKESLAHIRAFFSTRTPAHFFRVVAPLTVLLLVASIALNWGGRMACWYAGALALLIIADGVTFAVHYPRNKIMFIAPLSDDAELLMRTAREWARWNVLRLVLLALSIAVIISGLLSVQA